MPEVIECLPYPGYVSLRRFEPQLTRVSGSDYLALKVYESLKTHQGLVSLETSPRGESLVLGNPEFPLFLRVFAMAAELGRTAFLLATMDCADVGLSSPLSTDFLLDSGNYSSVSNF